jgi:hypothetical protein
MSRQEKKILFAAVDIGYRIELYSQFIRKHLPGVLKAESLSIYILPSDHYKTSYTYEYHFQNRSVLYRWYRSLLNFCTCLFRYDIFHFISGETLLPRKLRRLELWTYKLFGKRVVMQFVGADIRSPEYITWKDKHMAAYLDGKTDFPKTKPWQNKLIRDAVKYADYILVSTPDLLELIPKAHYFPVVIDLEKFERELQAHPPANNPATPAVTILHCPSNVQVKGTEYIHDILKRVALNFPDTVHLILPAEQRKKGATNYASTRYDLFKLYQEADIIIDQMIIGWYGLQSIEGLIAGKEVVCYIDSKLDKYLYPDTPIRSADINTLEKTITDLIQLRLTQKTNPSAGDHQAWVKTHYTIEQNHRELLNAWGVDKTIL